MVSMLQICVEEASDSSDGEVLQEHDDHKAEAHKAVNKKPRFDFPVSSPKHNKASSLIYSKNKNTNQAKNKIDRYGSSSGKKEVFSDPEMEREYQTLLADSDDDVIKQEVTITDDESDEFVSASDPELLLAEDEKSRESGSDNSVTFVTPRTPRTFLRSKSDSDAELSDLDIQKEQAAKIFNRRARV